MQTENSISVQECCMHYEIEFSFLQDLHQHGLIDIAVDEEKDFISSDQLAMLERCLHLHQDLDINMEGLEAIMHLLQRIHKMHNEITGLKNRLRLYEEL